MIKNLSLRSKIIVGSVSAILIPVLFAGIITYSKLSNSILEIYREKAYQLAIDMSNLISTIMEQELKFARSMAVDPEVVNALNRNDYQNASREIKSILNSLGADYRTFFIMDSKGIIRSEVTYPEQIGLDLSDRDYFIRAKKGISSIGGPVIARGPKHSRIAGTVVILVCSPIHTSRGFSGALTTVFDADYFIKKISTLRVGKTGYPFIINESGVVIFHPFRKELILNYDMHEIPTMSELIRRIDLKETGTEEYTFEGIKKIAGFAPINLTGWTVAFTQNRSEIMGPVNSILVSLLISALIFLAITIFITVIISGRISLPVQKMMNLMEQMFIHSRDAILNIGLDHRITYANPAVMEIMGCALERIIGAEPILTNAGNIPPEEIWRRLENGEIWTGRLMIKNCRDKNFIFAVFIIPIKETRGTIQGYLQIGRDITMELVNEERHRQSQKMEALGSMAGGIAHDFNNILSGIMGYTELSLSVEGNPPLTREYISNVMKASERARELITQILTFSRKTDVALKAVAPAYVIKDAINLLKVSAPSGVKIKADLESRSVIMADPTQLHQIIMNLSTNSIYAMKDLPGGEISISLRDLLVTEKELRIYPELSKGRHVLLTVSDTGSGIDPDKLEHIFDPFFTTKPVGQGTGMGLAVVHSIIKNMKGIITVESAPGAGATFRIIIPAEDAAITDKARNNSMICAGNEHVIFVDDEEAILKTARIMLSNQGYRVTVFSDARSALERFRSDSRAFDIMVTDYSMPEMTGMELIREIRAIRKDFPVILSSGYMNESMEAEARKAGVDELLPKPVTIHELCRVIRMCLDRRAS